MVEAGTDNVWMPFRSVRGKTVDVQTNSTFNPAVPGNEYWLNPYFDQITSNEIAGAATAADGTGAELFNLVTGIESSGLGCGQMTEPVADGSKKVPRCWIVIVPRGTGVEENAGTQFAADENGNDLYGVSTSPLTPAAWKNRIAIEISFNPVDSPCALGVQERRISGTALALPAVFSWQPKLCEAGTLPPYSFAPINGATARSQLLSRRPAHRGWWSSPSPSRPTW